jgi:hypothetical protein
VDETHFPDAWRKIVEASTPGAYQVMLNTLCHPELAKDLTGSPFGL